MENTRYGEYQRWRKLEMENTRDGELMEDLGFSNIGNKKKLQYVISNIQSFPC